MYIVTELDDVEYSEAMAELVRIQLEYVSTYITIIHIYIS